MPRFLSSPSSHALPAAIMPLAVAASLLLAGCGTRTDAQAVPGATSEPVPVRTVSLLARTPVDSGTIRVTGTLAGKEEVGLSFKIGGVISRIVPDPGQRVLAGQVLAELRPTEIAAQVASARASRDKAQRDLDRVQRLYADSVATLEQLQDARTGLDVATNALRVAQFNAEYAVIRSPGDGVVLSRTAEPGQVVEPGRPVLTVRRNGRGMVVRIGLPDRDAVGVSLGSLAEVTFDAMPDHRFTGRVTQRAAAASAGTGDYAAEVTLLGNANELPSGLVAHVTLRSASMVRRGDARVLVPLDALVDADGDSAAVFVLSPDGKSVARRTVRLTDVAEALRTALVPIVAGLDGTETVIVAGMSRLIDGTKVTVVNTPARRAAAGGATEAAAAP